ncbi:MAG: tRNA (adenosine(37)-N6)-threonylcarbamoyltransferase complex dimerization subunit type 1 TsaB [Gammaproteobacteria bacterium]
MKTLLAVDTATEACSVALCIDGATRELFEPMQREHTRRVLPMVQQLLAEGGRTLAQVDGIACGIGPGSFAGLRIGVGVVKGLALARDLPVVGVSSLAMLAQRAIRLEGARQVAAVIDARMSEVYFGAYRRAADGRVEAMLADQVGAAATVPRLPPGSWRAVGTGWGRYEAELRAATGLEETGTDATALPHAEDALVLALPEFAAGRTLSADALAPAYLRDRVALTLEEQAALRR